MSAKAGKRPLRSLTAHEKLDAIRRVHDGESKASVARDIGVPESTLRGWCKNEDKISYLSRQSSPETDESAEKKPKLVADEPYNLSLKTDACPVDFSQKSERNRAELARLSVELGLNRPEIFIPNSSTTSNGKSAELNVNLLTQWNSLLLQQQLQTKKITAAADTTNLVSSTGLLTTVQEPKLPKFDKPPSVEDSVWYWLKTQQAMLLANQNPSTTATTPTTTSNAPDQNSSWFWKWYKQYTQQQSLPTQQDKPILYQQLTKNNSDSENMEEEPPRSNPKARAVLDNLLFNNNNNVAVNGRRDSVKEDEDVSQSEALEHGEKFLKWLEGCSEPSVTAVQIMQFRYLLNNVKSGADRKNGDLVQNKAKVKRK